jgi:hypothetical protein
MCAESHKYTLNAIRLQESRPVNIPSLPKARLHKNLKITLRNWKLQQLSLVSINYICVGVNVSQAPHMRPHQFVASWDWSAIKLLQKTS